MADLLTQKEINRNKLFFPEPTKHDWKDDFKYENGNYMAACHCCGEVFRGYKGRLICNYCASTQKK